MKKRILPLLCLTLMSVYTACKTSDTQDHQATATAETRQQTPSQSPKEVVDAFMHAFVTERDLKRAYDFFSSQDKQAKSEADYIKEKSQGEWEPMLKKFNSYTVKSSEIRADTATVEIEVKTIDVMKLLQEAMGDKNLLQLAAMKKEDVDAMTEKNLAVYADGKKAPPMTRAEDTVNLIKENGEWKLFADWTGAQAKEAAKKVTLNLGETGPLMHAPDKGDVNLKVNAVKFTTATAPAGQAFCIVNVTLNNAMNGQFTENYIPTASAFLTAEQGNKYVQDHFVHHQVKAKMIDNLSPLNPGKSKTGDLIFAVDKNAKALVLHFDAGCSPIPENYDHEEGKSLSFKLGDVAL